MRVAVLVFCGDLRDGPQAALPGLMKHADMLPAHSADCAVRGHVFSSALTTPTRTLFPQVCLLETTPWSIAWQLYVSASRRRCRPRIGVPWETSLPRTGCLHARFARIVRSWNPGIDRASAHKGRAPRDVSPPSLRTLSGFFGLLDRSGSAKMEPSTLETLHLSW